MRKRGFEIISYNQAIFDFGKNGNIETLYSDIEKPIKGTKNSAAYDFLSAYDFELNKGEKLIVSTGIKAYMLEDEFLAILVRSSAGFKYNIRLCNQVGIIDSDYYNNEGNEGHIFIALQNEGERKWIVKKGEAYAQAIFMKYLPTDDENIKNKERKGGIGSTNGGDTNG